jgi:hypothetical protein
MTRFTTQEVGMRSGWMGLALVILIVPGPSFAQSSPGEGWSWSAGITASLVLGDSDWSMTHPYHGSGGTTWETLSGTFSSSIRVLGDLEVRRDHFGFRGSVGVLPQTFTQESPAQEEDFTLLTGGISGVVYPLGGDDRKWEPFAALGVGGQKATGGLDNSGYYFSVSGGIRAWITGAVAVEGGAEYQRLKYTQVDLGDNIQKDLKATLPSVSLGTRIVW